MKILYQYCQKKQSKVPVLKPQPTKDKPLPRHGRLYLSEGAFSNCRNMYIENVHVTEHRSVFGNTRSHPGRCITVTSQSIQDFVTVIRLTERFLFQQHSTTLAAVTVYCRRRIWICQMGTRVGTAITAVSFSSWHSPLLLRRLALFSSK